MPTASAQARSLPRVAGSDLSAAAGLLPQSWTKFALAAAFLNLASVIAGMWYVPQRVPLLLRRLIQIVGMAGALWSAGTLVRVVYALSG